jgi:hypothetical protein
MNSKIFIPSVILTILSFGNLIYSQSSFLSFKNGESKFVEQKTNTERILSKSDTHGADITFHFDGAYISQKNVKGEEYQFVTIDGLTHIGTTGAPAVPVRNEIIAMPRGSDGIIQIIESEYYEYQAYNIHPVLEPARDTEGSPEPEFKKDEKVYSTDSFFPGNIVEIVSVAINRNTPLAKVQIRPVQYNPVTQTIRVYTKISFNITYTGGDESFEYIAEDNSLHYTNLLKLNVLNSEVIPDGIQKNQTNKTESKNYIIITHTEYEAQANELANWKRQMGYGVEIISNSDWTPSTVKTAVEDRYDTWIPKPDYLLIIGDHNGSFPVPGNNRPAPNGTDSFATDLYYVCMDGTYDWHPDMAHGRISVSSIVEADIVINKIINYEKTPVNDVDFYNNILNCAQYQDDDNNAYADRRFCHTSEEIRDYLQDMHFYNSERIYYSSTTADIQNLRYNNGYYSNGELLPEELRSYSFNWNGGASEIQNAVNQGKFMLFHRDHGYVGGSGWAHPYFTTSSINNLNNQDKLPVVFSINCHTGEFQLNNCFSEKLLREENKGAVGVVAAAFYSYSGYNDAISIGMIDAIWADPGIYPNFGSSGTGNSYTIGAENAIYTMGDVVNQGLYAMEQNFDGYSSGNKYSFELFHYFGDPAMKIWTANPYENVIVASHSNEINCTLTEFEITNSIPYATASLVFNDRLLAVSTLDENGNGTINYSIDQAGDIVSLTVSSHNHLPYITDLSVTGDCQFTPIVETYTAEMITDISAELNGEIIHDGNEVITESGFVISTNEDPLLGEPGVITIVTDPVVTSGLLSCTADNLQSNTLYYFKAYSINNAGTAYGYENSFETMCEPINSFPWIYDFESLSDLNDCWTQEYISGDDISWEIIQGDAWSGNSYIYLFDNDYEEDNTLLISPMLDLSSMNNPVLSYWYYLQGSFVGHDELKTLYRTDVNDNWTELNHITDSNEDWTELILPLSDVSDQYQIAFSGYLYRGNGVHIDYITIDDLSEVTDISENDVVLYPNPNSGEFVLMLPEANTAKINIFNMNGQLISSHTTYNNLNNMNTEYLTAGFYLIQILQDGKIYYQNLIIK